MDRELLEHELSCYKKFVENLHYWLKSDEIERVWDKDELEHESEIIEGIKALKEKTNGETNNIR